MDTLNIEASIGVFQCFRCGSKGSWFDFKRLVSGESTSESHMSRMIGLSSAYSQESVGLKGEDINMLYNSLANLLSTENEVFTYVSESRGISKETMMFYRVGMKEEKFRQEDGRYNYDQ